MSLKIKNMTVHKEKTQENTKETTNPSKRDRDSLFYKRV